MNTGGRILALGGHEFDRRHTGNDAICDLIVDLAESSHPRICLLPTASGDREDQIGNFRRAFGERDCEPSSISLFRRGLERIDLREHLLAQDVIYAGGGSLLNLVTIWRAHGVDAILRDCWEEGILIVGQSAGAMCWFESGVTSSIGDPTHAPGLGFLEGSACVHYLFEPERRAYHLRAVASGEMPPGLGLEDQTGVLFEGGRMAGAWSARPGAGVWRVTAAGEERLPASAIEDELPALDAAAPDEILEFRETLAARRGVGRLD